MWLELRAIFNTLSTSPDTRAIILSGAGPAAFTSGLDVASAASDPLLPNNKNNKGPHDGARTATRLRRHILEFQSCISAVSACEKPVVAAIHGHCLGLGVDLALCADVRFCAPGTKFAVKEVDIGLAADIGTLSRLPKVVGGGSWVKDVCLSGRVFGAREAREVGFVSWVGAGGAGAGAGGGRGEKEVLLTKALEWAVLVAGKSPVAVQGTKEVLNWSWDRGVEEGLRYTAVWNSAMLQGGDTREAMGPSLGRRRAGFEKL